MTMGIHGYCSEQVITDKFITPLYNMYRSGNIYFHITVDEYQYLREFVLRNFCFATKNFLYSTPCILSVSPSFPASCCRTALAGLMLFAK